MILGRWLEQRRRQFYLSARIANMRLILASASPSRLRLLRAAGIDPEVVVSAVDEDQMLEQMPDASGPRPPR